MNSEKIKELKKFIKVSAELGCYYKLANCDITMLEVLEYINKLESQNKQFKQLREVDYKTMTILRKANIELNECMGERQDRIVELESELEKEQINNLNCDTELQYKEKRIAELEKENDEQYKRIMELEQDLVHADEKVFYRECNVTLRENEIKQQAIKQFAEKVKDSLEEYRLENEYFTEHEPNGNLWQMNASVFYLEVTQDGGLIDQIAKEVINE